MNKSACQLFEELGYELDERNPKEILYKMKWEISSTYWISFDIEHKRFNCFITSDSPFTPSESLKVSLEELKAINQQIKELGWLDE